MSPAEPPVDRRAAPRGRTLLRGRICHGPHYVISVPCGIKNLTAEGALLQIADLQPLPPAFALINITAGLAYEAQLTWRQDNLAGVALRSCLDLHQPVEGELKALRRIWMALAPA